MSEKRIKELREWLLKSGLMTYELNTQLLLLLNQFSSIDYIKKQINEKVKELGLKNIYKQMEE